MVEAGPVGTLKLKILKVRSKLDQRFQGKMSSVAKAGYWYCRMRIVVANATCSVRCHFN